MTQQLVPCLVCGRPDHSSASCTNPLAGAMQRAAQQEPQGREAVVAPAARNQGGLLAESRREPV